MLSNIDKIKYEIDTDEKTYYTITMNTNEGKFSATAKFNPYDGHFSLFTGDKIARLKIKEKMLKNRIKVRNERMKTAYKIWKHTGMNDTEINGYINMCDKEITMYQKAIEELKNEQQSYLNLKQAIVKKYKEGTKNV